MMNTVQNESRTTLPFVASILVNTLVMSEQVEFLTLIATESRR